MSTVRKEMDRLAEEAKLLADKVERGTFSPEEAGQILRNNAGAWERYGRIVSRLERHLKLSDPAQTRIIDLERELVEVREQLARAQARQE